MIGASALPGDLKEYVVYLDDYDITNAANVVTIYQDIFTPTWSCQVMIDDTENLIMTLPIRPGAKIKIKAKTQLNSKTDDAKEFKFELYKIGDRQFENQGHQSYVLYCVTHEFLVNQGKRVIQTFSNEKPNKIIERIISEYIKGSSVKSDETDNAITATMSNWSPFTCASWLAKSALNKSAADYIFYMEDENKFRFVSLEKSYTSNDSEMTFSMKPSHIREKGQLVDDYNVKFKDWYFENYDSLQNQSSGYYTSKLLAYDMIKKSITKKIYKFGEDIQKDLDKKYWDADVFESENLNVAFSPKYENSFTGSVETWHGSRKNNIMKLEQDRLVIQLPGGVKAWQWLGKSCTVELPSNQGRDASLEQDKYYKGKYLITAISHYMGKHGYMVNLEMIKKRLNEKPQ